MDVDKISGFVVTPQEMASSIEEFIIDHEGEMEDLWRNNDFQEWREFVRLSVTYGAILGARKVRDRLV